MRNSDGKSFGQKWTTFHLPGKLFSVSVSYAETPVSSW